jgi:RND family efflux transporter MFP subunit
LPDLHLLKELKIDSGHRDVDDGPRRWPLIVAIAVLIVAAAGVGAYFTLGGRRVEVQTATAVALRERGGEAAVLQATGYVTARRQATVSAQITGTVADILIEEGDHVAAGQVLAHLNATAQRAQLAQAEAQRNASQATLMQVRAQLAQARRDLVRTKGLIERKLVSDQALEAAATQVDMLAAQADAQQRQVELSDAGVQAARVQLDYATVRAPFAGVVTAKAAQVGEIVSPLSAGGGFTRTGVGTIVDMTSLEVEVDVNEAYINRVVPEQPGEAVLDAYPNWTIPVHVIAIIPTADRGKATVKVRLGLNIKDPRILPEMGVRVSFLENVQKTATAQTGVLVPASAVVERDGRNTVFEIAAGRAHAVAVTPGATYGDMRVVDGIRQGVAVVKQPPAELKDGTKVELNGQAK